MLRILIWCCCLMTTLSLWAQSPTLGEITFANSGKTEAQESFINGVLLLHSFEYEDAAEYFQEARRIDPGFSLAYWGEAMTYNHPIWHRQYYDKGVEVLNQLAPDPQKRMDKAELEVEKDLIRAVDLLYGEGSKYDRDLRYSKFMQDLHEKYPENLEVASFYALSILGTSHEGRVISTYLQAAEIAGQVYSLNPNHPGAVHYLIHSYDDPINAPLGLQAANRYAEIAPDASHALHMPSHIFVAMGLWDEVVKSNEESWAAADERVKRKDLLVDDRGFHALHWLEYGYLQQGRYSEALKWLRTMESDTRKSGSKRTRYHLAVMRAGYLIETREWNGPVVEMDVDVSDLRLSTIAADHLASGMSAVNLGDLNGARSILEQMQNIRISLKSNRLDDAVTLCGVYATGLTSTPEVAAALIMEKELEALILNAEGRTDQAELLIKEAVSLEDELDFMFGPPKVVKPSPELYGELLLEWERPKEAAYMFSEGLKRAPKRTLTLAGLQRAFKEAGKTVQAQEVEVLVQNNLKNAD